MPTLQFKGKNIIWNHHLSIPYHTLDEVTKLDFQAKKGEGNLIIEGDNLLALKALMPQYQDRIKCIYIDPPYNTGNEGWIYNDKVNSPLIKEWLGKEVGKDDMTRHDKWLCMMVPRLKILRDLLADDGAIFISIDDNEQHSLRQIMDEMFGDENYLSSIIWQHSIQGKGYEGSFSVHHNYLLCYQKTSMFTLNLLERTDEDNTHYSNPDHDPNGDWRNGDIRNALFRPNLIYDVKTPSGNVIKPPENGWRFSKETMEAKRKRGQIVFNKDQTRLIYKIYLKDQRGRVPETIWFAKDSGTTRTANDLLKELFNGKTPFDTPKPIELLKKVITLCCDQDGLVLDSFAGSGTTMHAVMDLNKDDDGSRKCIMVQMTEATKKEPNRNICKDITRERVKRAIEKYGYESGVKYLRVGDPIDPESMLSGILPTYRQFAKYVYYLCTGEYLREEDKINESTYFVGLHRQHAIYLVYKKDFDALTRLALNLPLAETILKAHKGKKCIVYAPACFLDEEYLQERNLEFVGIPYNLFRKNG